MRICPYCNQPIRLQPSATERAESYGGKPSDYTDLFPYHAECFVADRSRQSSELMAAINNRLINGAARPNPSKCTAEGNGDCGCAFGQCAKGLIY